MNKKKYNDPTTKEAGSRIIFLIIGILFFAGLALGLMWFASVDMASSNSIQQTSGTPVDSAAAERTMIEVDDPYLVKDGKSFMLIKPEPIGLSIYRDKDHDGKLDHVVQAMVIKKTGELHEWGEGRDLLEYDPMRQRTLEEYQDSLKVY